jgi:hypothetical protein
MSVVSRSSKPCIWSGPTKCIFPERIVRYPARRSEWANVGTDAGNSSALSLDGTSLGSRPVIIAALEGTHSGALQ